MKPMVPAGLMRLARRHTVHGARVLWILAGFFSGVVAWQWVAWQWVTRPEPVSAQVMIGSSGSVMVAGDANIVAGATYTGSPERDKTCWLNGGVPSTCTVRVAPGSMCMCMSRVFSSRNIPCSISVTGQWATVVSVDGLTDPVAVSCW